MKILSLLLCLLLSTTLVGCKKSSPPDGPPKHSARDLSKVKDAVPKVEPLSKYGNRFGKNGKSNIYTEKKKKYKVMPTSKNYKARGQASWYGTKFHGRRTSSGEKYDMYEMTAAHRTLPLPTYARITNLENGKNVIVKINDRGPFHSNRIIDVSYAAAHRLGLIGKGTGHVEIESVDPRDHGRLVHHKKAVKTLKIPNPQKGQKTEKSQMVQRKRAKPEVAKSNSSSKLYKEK